MSLAQFEYDISGCDEMCDKLGGRKIKDEK